MTLPTSLIEALSDGTLVPYLGPRMLELAPEYAVPGTPAALAARLTAKASVPHKIRNRLTQSAQFIENFKHRKTLVQPDERGVRRRTPVPSPLHRALAALRTAADRRRLVRQCHGRGRSRAAPTGARCRGWRSPSISAPGPAGTTPTARCGPRRRTRVAAPCSTSRWAATRRPATTWCPTPTMSRC